mmetsp:Transcript_14607/g.33379  ORF Transcript_14607/g.33379 Transcript_14607/m.33379 type:complete len:81 (-) Transcript_14607:37-279(-)
MPGVGSSPMPSQKSARVSRLNTPSAATSSRDHPDSKAQGRGFFARQLFLVFGSLWERGRQEDGVRQLSIIWGLFDLFWGG